jgi:hypothetical protein
MNGNCGRLYSSVKNYTIFNLEMGGDVYRERERDSASSGLLYDRHF